MDFFLFTCQPLVNALQASSSFNHEAPLGDTHFNFCSADEETELVVPDLLFFLESHGE